MNITSRPEFDATITQIVEASTAYYTDGTSNLSDAQFDSLYDAASAYAEQQGIDAPELAKVASGSVSGDVAHSVPMLSLEKVTEDTAALTTWMTKSGIEQFSVEPKLDGLAVVIRYRNGKPVQMVTRGDGSHGEDVTYALESIDNIPAFVGGPSHRKGGISTRDIRGFDLEVRGEAVFTHDQFEGANVLREQHGDPVFANARNGVAGTLRGAKSRDYLIPFSFYAYDQIGLDTASHTDSMDDLESFGFATAAGLLGRRGPHDTGQVVTEVQAWAAAEPNVDTDGIVVKADRPSDRVRLGIGSRTPRWAIAYKYATQQVTSTLLEVEWTIGRTGRLSPRARIEPVELTGSTVTYASLHNPDDLSRKGFMLGDTVIVKKAGEIIPRLEAPVVADRDGSQTPIDVPTSCPNCGSDFETTQAVWRCVRGRGCAAVESVAYAVSRDALDIDGLSTSLVKRMIDQGVVTDLADLFTLTAAQVAAVSSDKVYGDTAQNRKADRVGRSVPVGSTVAGNIVTQIEKAKTAGLARVITSLGVRGTGRSMSRRLAKHFGSMDALRAASVDELATVEKIGTIKAAMIVDELAELSSVIDRMSATGVVMQDAPASTDTTDACSQPLAGMSVCVTGSMVLRTRSEMNETVESLGGRAASSVSKSTSLLVAGPGAGSKLDRAATLGVRVMTEDEFIAEYL